MFSHFPAENEVNKTYKIKKVTSKSLRTVNFSNPLTKIISNKRGQVKNRQSKFRIVILTNLFIKQMAVGTMCWSCAGHCGKAYR